MEVVYIFNYTPETFNTALQRLKCSIGSLQNQNVRIIVLNHSNSKLTPLVAFPIFEIHHPCYDNYNKAKSINHVVKNYIKGDYYLMSDVDIIVPLDYVEKMNQLSMKYKSCRVIPFIHRVMIEMYSFDYTEVQGYADTNIKNNQSLAAGIGLIHKPSWKAINGYDETFVGHGPEDHDFNLRIAKVCPVINDYTNIIYHLYHQPLRMNNSKNNCKYLEQRYMDYQNYIIANENKTIEEIGII